MALNAALLVALVLAPAAHADDAASGFAFASTALDELQQLSTTAHTAHDKRLRKTWGPDPRCLSARAAEIDASLAMVSREKGALAEMITHGRSGVLADRVVDQHIRAAAIARAHAQRAAEDVDECPLVRTTRERRRDRGEELAQR